MPHSTSRMVLDPAVSDLEPNPFYDPNYSAAQFIELAVSKVQHADSQAKFQGIDTDHQISSIKPDSYLRKIHDAAATGPSLSGVSNIGFTSPQTNGRVEKLPASQIDGPFDLPTGNYGSNSLWNPESFDLSHRVAMPDYNRGSSNSASQLSSDSSSNRIQPLTPEPESKVSFSQSDYHLLKFYRQMNTELQDKLYGPKFGKCSPESTRRLIRVIDALMPGIRLERNLEVQTSGVFLTYQMVLNYLMVHGFLSAPTLDLFRGLDGIKALDLRETLKACSLLLPSEFRVELLQVLARPNSFPYLKHINLAGTYLEDQDIRWISVLSSLRTLSLARCKIRDEAIAYLVPLKRTLTQLDISNNVRLTDDCCSSLCYLTGLKSLDIFQTGISITGLRRLVRDMPSSSSIDVNLTTACHEYLSVVYNRYNVEFDMQDCMARDALDMVLEPDDVHRLTVAQLESNIRAHTTPPRASESVDDRQSEFRSHTSIPEPVLEADYSAARMWGEKHLADAIMDVLRKRRFASANNDGDGECDVKRHALAQLLHQILVLRRANLKVLEILGWFDDESGEEE